MIAEPVFDVSVALVDEVDVDDVEEVDVLDVVPIVDVELLTLVTIKHSSPGDEQKPGQPKNCQKKGRGCPPPSSSQIRPMAYLSRVSTACGCWFA
jgi:hypothetical protein